VGRLSWVMKWAVKVVAEFKPGEFVEHDVATVEREDVISPAALGLSMAEGKAILEALQKQIVTA
jgi:hypothetical protein